jgi:hypothetical protein
MRKDINKVEIKNPPIGELKNKKSCFARTCLGGCGCVIVFIFACLLILMISIKPKAKEVKSVPDYITRSIPIHNQESINRIEVTPGEERNKLIEKLAIVPKAVIAPFVVEFKKIKNKQEKTEESEGYFDWNEMKKVINSPIADHRDIVEIEWLEVEEQPSFIFKNYKKELKRKDFDVEVSSDKPEVSQFTFEKEGIDGVIFIQDDIIERGTDYVLMRVKISS